MLIKCLTLLHCMHYVYTQIIKHRIALYKYKHTHKHIQTATHAYTSALQMTINVSRGKILEEDCEVEKATHTKHIARFTKEENADSNGKTNN